MHCLELDTCVRARVLTKCTGQYARNLLTNLRTYNYAECLALLQKTQKSDGTRRKKIDKEGAGDRT